MSQLGRVGETKQQLTSIHQARIVPKADHYVVEVVYEAEEKRAADLDPDLFVALDPGVSVLAALTSNKPGFVPRLVTGKPVKALSQLYNKQRAHQQKQLAKGNEPRFTSHREDGGSRRSAIGGGAWHPCNRHRRELHQPGQLAFISMCYPAMIPLKGPSRKTSHVSLAAAMAEGHVSKGVRLSIPM